MLADNLPHLNIVGKLRLALAQGKKLRHKREDTAKREWARQKARLLRGKG